MKFASALSIALLFLAGTVFAQIAPSPVKSSPPAETAPPAAAKSPQAQAPAPTKALAPETPSADKIDPAKEAAIRHLMNITETSKLGDNVANYFETRVRSVISEALGPERTTAFMATFSKKLEAGVPPSAVVDAMVPIYARAFSMEEIQGLIQFYDSPLGQRIVKVMPKVEQDSQDAGLQIGNKATLASLESMTDEYPELKQMLQAPDAAPPDSSAPGQPPASQTAPAPAPQK